MTFPFVYAENAEHPHRALLCFVWGGGLLVMTKPQIANIEKKLESGLGRLAKCDHGDIKVHDHELHRNKTKFIFSAPFHIGRQLESLWKERPEYITGYFEGLFAHDDIIPAAVQDITGSLTNADSWKETWDRLLTCSPPSELQPPPAKRARTAKLEDGDCKYRRNKIGGGFRNQEIAIMAACSDWRLPP